jgi:hypothetical protein
LANIDLLPYRAFTDPGSPIISPPGTIAPTFKVLVSNAGNSAPPISATIRFRDVTGGGNTLVGNVKLSPFTGCGTLKEASIVWPNLSPGLHMMRIEVDPTGQIGEMIESNNVMTTTILVGTHGVYMPIVRK